MSGSQQKRSLSEIAGVILSVIGFMAYVVNIAIFLESL